VFGAGVRTADVMLVGEQPGDQEDLAGQPFVGPAGRVLQEALTAAGAVLGRLIVIGRVRGQPLQAAGATVFVTAHPSAILRAPDPVSRARGRAQLVSDLAQAARAVAKPVES